MGVSYAELHAHSAYSFLHGADMPSRMVERAQQLGLSGIAVLDYDGMYSTMQTNTAARQVGIPVVQGTEIRLDSQTHLPILARNVRGYEDLCAAISHFQLAAGQKTDSIFSLEELAAHSHGNWTVLTGTNHSLVWRALKETGMAGAVRAVEHLRELFGHVCVESALKSPAQWEDAQVLHELAAKTGATLVATGAARAAGPESVRRAHVLRAIQLGGSLSQVQPYLEAYPPILRSENQMLQIHRHYPQAVWNAAEIAEELAFDVRLLAPQLPRAQVPAGYSEETWLRQCVEVQGRKKYGTRTQAPQAWALLDKELGLICSLNFAGYFLIVKEIVDYCAQNNILCQGRGSAANSAVCYALGITAVDAVRHKMMFERFISPGRSSPPDIDLDIEAQARERVIQHVYDKYGRECAAQVANVITYRRKSAVRDVVKAFGYSEDVARTWSVDLDVKADKNVMEMAQSVRGLPRHMGIHPGGMVLTRSPVSRTCPITWATKPGRTVLQWDKEDCEAAGLVKFDLLGLGMLGALRRMYDALSNAGYQWRGKPYSLHNMPQEDPKVYDLLCNADTVGVFQVESRAQMNTLPRLRPRCFYDIVIEVALIRPGPIQGQAVNPYLRRRAGEEPVTYPHPILKPVLAKTLGVALFQEQMMQLAVVGAGFTPAQADQLRKAMGSKHHAQRMESLRPLLFAGLAKNGITGVAADQIYESLQGFSEFGFPESHSFSFAYIVYASAWLKVHFPEEFYAAILASQPMGFYSPASLVQDARAHGVRVERADVNYSHFHASVEQVDAKQACLQKGGAKQGRGRKRIAPVEPDESKVVRLGLDSIRGVDEVVADRIVQARGDAAFTSLTDLAHRAGLSSGDVQRLAHAGALTSLGVSRRAGLWNAQLVASSAQQLTLPIDWELKRDLPAMSPTQAVVEDYLSTGLSVDAHPMQLVRSQLQSQNILTCQEAKTQPDGKRVKTAGVVTHRQRPQTAGGVVFLSLEDETGLVNVVCQRNLWERYRKVALTSRALIVRGMLETDRGAHVFVADQLLTCPIPVSGRSRDFR